MNLKVIALSFYFTVCILTVLGAFLESNFLVMLFKPMILLAIGYYYLTSLRTRIDWIYVGIIVFTFIGDIMILPDFETSTRQVMIPYALSYVLLNIAFFQDVTRIRFRLGNAVLGLAIGCFVMATAYFIIQSFNDPTPELFYSFMIYGLILAIQLGLAVYYFASNNLPAAFFMAITGIFNYVSDTFYAFFTLIGNIEHFYPVELTLQVFSYYFLTKYFLLRRIP